MIGCGRIGSLLDEGSPAGEPPRTHAKAFAADPRCRLVSLYDSDEARAAAARTRWNAESAASSLDEFLAQRLDIVSVCTPVSAQGAVLERLLANRTPVIFCEKPFGRDCEEAQRLIEAVEKTDSMVAVNYLRRYDPRLQALRRELRAGVHGRMQKAICHYGKGLTNNGSHILDWLIAAFSAPTAARYLSTVHDDRAETDDPSDSALLRFSSPVTGEFDAALLGQDHRLFSAFEIDLFTENGRVQILDSGRELVYSSVADDRQYPGYRSLKAGRRRRGGLQSTFTNAIREMIGLWRGDIKEASHPLRDSLAVHRAIGAVRMSKAARGREVKA